MGSHLLVSAFNPTSVWFHLFLCDKFNESQRLNQLGYAPKVIASSHWVFEYELGATTSELLANMEDRTRVKVAMFDIYGRLFDETIEIDADEIGVQRRHISFEGFVFEALISPLFS